MAKSHPGTAEQTAPSTVGMPPQAAPAKPLLPVVDNTSAGPFVPKSGVGIIGSLGAGLSASPSELMVEIELAAGSDSVAAALTANTSAFLASAGAPVQGAPLSAVLNQYGLLEARPVFGPERVQADRDRLDALRAAATTGADAQERVSSYERLPPLGQFVRLRFASGASAQEVTAALQRLPEVKEAVIVPTATPPEAFASPPSDPLIGGAALTTDAVTRLESQWYLHRMRVPAAWRFGRGAEVVVADIDWGYRTTHEDLQSAIKKTYNAVDGSSDVSHGPHAAHGTAVLGIAGARANAVGIAGFAPEAELWAIQGDSSASGQRVFAEPWAEAIDYVRRTDAGARRKVIILEVQTGIGGNYEQIPSVRRAIQAAIVDGCVVCVAAGNGNRPADRNDADQPFEPTGSILVGATEHHSSENKRAFFSNFGSRVTVCAPGDLQHDVTCGQTADNAYRNGFGGTSGATPKVAGTVALMLSVNPGLSHEDVREILSGTGLAVTETSNKPIGALVNAEAAVAEALRRRSETEPARRPVQPVGAPPTPAEKQFHGVHRRKSQLSLPKDTDGPMSWYEVDERPQGIEEAPPPVSAPGDVPPSAADKPLRVFRASVEGTLTRADRILIVEQAIEMLDNFYVHRPLKEAMHAVRPIQRLRVLLRRLRRGGSAPSTADPPMSELSFHNALTEIFNSVRDLHTGYQLPRPYRDCIAYLPFEIAPFYDEGRRRYLVTRVVPGYVFADPLFASGAELLYWNGMSIERAVRANAEQTAGSNDAARHARGVSALTIRPMNTALPPDADFVDLEFVPPDEQMQDGGTANRMRQSWFVRYAPPTSSSTSTASRSEALANPTASSPSDITFAPETSLDLARESVARSADLVFSIPSPTPAAAPQAPGPTPSPWTSTSEMALAAVLGIDTATDAVREARRLIFEPAALRGAGDEREREGLRGSASPTSASDANTDSEINIKFPWNAAFRARRVLVDGVSYGHIRIHTFYVPDADGFVAEFIRLLGQMPETGLILDVRGNGGGNILAAERLLQTLTPIEIEPERLQFIVSAGTLDLCMNNPALSAIPLDQWLPSIEEGVETGSVYSHAFPLTDKASCNAIGQQYYGPVLLIVDGNCYSATDIFAAGFQDHQVGPVLGTSNATGAGGANVWEHRLLHRVLPANWGLKPLPAQASMRVAIRQCLRVGRKAGALLEDYGVVPDSVHLPTRADLLDGDRDLIAQAVAVLKSRPVRSIRVTMDGATTDGKRKLTIDTQNLKRLDFFVDGRPQASRELEVDAFGKSRLAGAAIRTGVRLRLVGYAESTDQAPAALHQLTVS